MQAKALLFPRGVLKILIFHERLKIFFSAYTGKKENKKEGEICWNDD